MSDEEGEIEAEEVAPAEEPAAEPEPEPEPEAEPEAAPAEAAAAPPVAPSPAPPASGRGSGAGTPLRRGSGQQGPKPVTSFGPKHKDPVYSPGKPGKFGKDKLMASDGIIPLQSGSNKWASQKLMTGFGVPRDVARDQKTFSPNIKEVTDEKKIGNMRTEPRQQSGTNIFASQKGMTGFGVPRDVLSKSKGTGGVTKEIPEEKARASEGIVILQSGTNQLASQAGMTGFGMPRLLFNAKVNPEQSRPSQGFIHLQMGTNKYADQSNQKVDLGKGRGNITKFTDTGRKEIPHDETVLSRQTTGWKEGANQQGMRGFSAFRLQTDQNLINQDRKSQGLIPYQMGINWAESQTGKTAFGCPRQVFTSYTDDSNREELPDNMARMPFVPFWSGAEDFASQSGMTCPGMPRDVTGKHIHRLW